MENTKNITVLKPVHTSFESAYEIQSYPYGRLRTKMRVWINTTKNGQRVVSCTLNPKTDQWNKPHMSTYDVMRVLLIDNTNGHLVNDGIGEYHLLDKSQEFLDQYSEALTEEQKDKLTLYSVSNTIQEVEGIRLTENRPAFYARLKEVLTSMGKADLFPSVKKEEAV